MLSKKMEEALNKQINEEFYSYYLYLSMSAWFASKSMEGFARWMSMQAQEEMIHTMKFYNHILERSAKVKLLQINEPKSEWQSPLEIFENTLEHERHITGCINSLVRLAMDENDFASNSFLQWFIDEQVEEEATANNVLDQLKAIGDNSSGLFMLDREMAGRPAPTAVDGGK